MSGSDAEYVGVSHGFDAIRDGLIVGVRSIVTKFIPSYCGQMQVHMGIDLSISRTWNQLGTRFDICDVVLCHPISFLGLVVESVESDLYI